ncbi:stomatin-like [Bolinopsis microptera]|uniref:stomatin-like n=1 Tax=Bolinopsis microptera TaxID=2820187 RepID=UPI00307938EB
MIVGEHYTCQCNVSVSKIVSTIVSMLITILTFPLSLFFVIKVVQQYEKAVIFRLGEIKNKKGAGPGLFTYLPCLDDMRIVDMRTISFDVAPQEILTKDSVTVTVDAVVYYRIHDAIMSVCNVDDVQKATKLLAQTTLRNMLGIRTLAGILSEREMIANGIQNTLDEATDPWGVVVERVEVKDVKLPVSLQRAMAAEAEADRDARAKVVAAKGELQASRALKDAADIISESPAALQLRYLQTLCTVAAEKNSTILFPIPVDIMKSFMK